MAGEAALLFPQTDKFGRVDCWVAVPAGAGLPDIQSWLDGFEDQVFLAEMGSRIEFATNWIVFTGRTSLFKVGPRYWRCWDSEAVAASGVNATNRIFIQWGVGLELRSNPTKTVDWLLQKYGHIQHGSYWTLTYLMRNSGLLRAAGRSESVGLD